MSFTTVLFLVGPFIILTILGVVSIYLTYSGYFPGRARVGWAMLGSAFAVFVGAIVLQAGTGPITFETFGALAYTIMLSPFIVLQGPLILELISLTVIPDPSKGLKPLKVHTDAEKKVVEEDLPGAIAEYERIIAEDPEDLDARFRLAELCCENKEYRKGAATYEALLKYAQGLGMNRHCTVLTRLSEIYARHLHDVVMARGYTQAIIERYPDTKYAEFAGERLSNL